MQTSPEEPQFIPDFDNVMSIRLVIVIQENKTIIVTQQRKYGQQLAVTCKYFRKEEISRTLTKKNWRELKNGRDSLTTKITITATHFCLKK